MPRDERLSAGRYEVLTQLATGGMAEIWLARERGVAGLERLVVIKRLLSHLSSDESIVDMFVSEARFVARLTHPNVVQIHELAEDEEGYFLVMEYVAGCSVRELLAAASKDSRELPADVGVSIVEQVCRGAHAAHELCDPSGKPLGLVHRDISPHNLMITAGGDVKLLDFGIAKATALADGTHTGTLKGKFGYMSPEQCRAKRLDRRSDVFAIGVVLWELLTARRLFVRESEFETMQAVVEGLIAAPSSVRADLPCELDAVVLRSLAREREDRFETADQMRRALVEAAEAAHLRVSRDPIAAQLGELLGERLEQRRLALLDAVDRSADSLDRSALLDALLDPEASGRRAASSSRSRVSLAGVDEAMATVVQRRSSHPREPGDAEDPDSHVVGELSRSVTGSMDERTVDRTRVDSRPMRASSAPAEPASIPTSTSGSASAVSPLATDPLAHEPVRLGVTASLPAGLPATAPPPRARRLAAWIAAAVVVVVAVGTAAWWWGFRRPEQRPEQRPAAARVPTAPEIVLTGPPLRIVLPPTVSPDVLRRELEPLLGYLRRQLRRPVTLVIARGYEGAADSLASRTADVGILPPLLYVRTAARIPGLEGLVVKLFDGARTSDGYLLVRSEDPISDAAALRGRLVCYVDRDSTTGFLLPRLWLRQHQIDPDRDVRPIHSGNHLQALRDLSAGRCDAAAVYSGAFLSGDGQGIAVGRMRVLAITGRSPQDVVAAGPSMPAADRASLRASLLAFDPQRDLHVARLGDVQRVTGFAPVIESELDLIRAADAAESHDGGPAQAHPGHAR